MKRRKNHPRIAFWDKDGAWHITIKFTPTDADRERFFESYPPGDDGPFYRWSSESFGSVVEAAHALENQS